MASEKFKIEPVSDFILCRQIAAEKKVKSLISLTDKDGKDLQQASSSRLLDFDFHPYLFEVVEANEAFPKYPKGTLLCTMWQNRNNPNGDSYPYIEPVHGGNEILCNLRASYVHSIFHRL